MSSPSLSDRRQRKSIYWYNKSSDLIGSAAALWTCRDAELSSRIVTETGLGDSFSLGMATPPVYKMLCGMAIELVLKAIVVEGGGVVNTKGHDLLGHWRSTSLPLAPAEEPLLRVLSHAVVWAGRYPTPKKNEDMDAYHEVVDEALYDRVPLAAGSSACILRPNHALNWEGFSALWRRASDHYWHLRSQHEPI